MPLVARPLAATALPALNPNQPNHSSAAPRMVNGRLCGGMGVWGKPRRRPMTTAATSAEMPELMCTTVPPAKSSAPIVRSQPPTPQTQWASGVVHDGAPEHQEEHERLELHPLREGARDERRGDRGEHALVNHVGLMRHGRGIVRIGLQADAAQTDPVEPADEPATVGPEAERIAPENPGDADKGDRDDALQHRAEHVLAAHHAAVEKRQRRRHQHDERGRQQQKRGVSCVDGAGGVLRHAASLKKTRTIPETSRRPLL